MSPEFAVVIHAVDVEDSLGIGGVGEADAADHGPSTIWILDAKLQEQNQEQGIDRKVKSA